MNENSVLIVYLESYVWFRFIITFIHSADSFIKGPLQKAIHLKEAIT